MTFYPTPARLMIKTMTMTDIEVTPFVLDTGLSTIKLKATMNRYRPLKNAHHACQRPGHILFFGHGTGFHKESWEPIIERIFANDKNNNGPTRILEAWAIDYQTHGEAAALNEDVFSRVGNFFTIHEYADAFVKLHSSGLLGAINKGIQKLVLVGHSAGAMGMISATALYDPLSSMPFDKLILVDPPLYTESFADKMTDLFRRVQETTPSRRATWKSREDAHQWLKTRAPWKYWDPRILKLYIEYGLRELPTLSHPDKTGVTLCCSPADESGAFNGSGDTPKAIEHLNQICKIVPVHLVYGARNDLFSREAQDSVIDPQAGRIMASIRRINGAGHLIVQEKPDAVADAVLEILNPNSGSSKL